MGGLDFGNFVQIITVWALPVLLAITFHEAAHGFVAKRFGDATAWAMGRVTFNPIKHIDPFGTIILPLALGLMGAPILGYAKPVPVNFSKLKPWRSGVAAVALAGPAANLILLLLSIPLLYASMWFPGVVGVYVFQVAMASIAINVILMVFNLLPLPPLDGSRVLQAVLPPKYSYMISRYEWLGMFVILFLAFTGILFTILQPLLELVYTLLAPLLPVSLN